MANATDRPRCSWSTKTAQECAYHDAEWGVPVRDSRMLWETLMLEGFQAGLAWSVCGGVSWAGLSSGRRIPVVHWLLGRAAVAAMVRRPRLVAARA